MPETITPAMRRLCEVAKAADPTHGTPLAIDDGAALAIVRAVLAELPDAGREGMPLNWTRDLFVKGLRTMISHVEGKPAEARP